MVLAPCLTGRVQPVTACTGIRLTAADGTVVDARTLEFAIDIHSEVLMVPRGYARTGSTPDGKEGLKWTAKYASIGLNGVGLPILFDGLNEKGLAAGLFYFPTSAGFMPYTAADAPRTIAQWEVGSWILENFASVDEVKANIDDIVVPAVVFGEWGFAPETHYVVHDASGKSIVIEYVSGKLNVYDNPLGVITNSPGFDWQMTNLRNYVNFSMTNVPPVKLGAGHAPAVRAGLGHARHAGGLHAAVSLRSRRGVLPVGADVSDRRRRRVERLPRAEPVRHSQGCGARAREGRAWQRAGGLHRLDWRQRSEGQALLLPDVREQPIRSLDLMKMSVDGKDIVTMSMQGGEAIKSLTP